MVELLFYPFDRAVTQDGERHHGHHSNERDNGHEGKQRHFAHFVHHRLFHALRSFWKWWANTHGHLAICYDPRNLSRLAHFDP